MKICILGSGNIGSTIGKKWAHAGHEIVFGVRDPQEKHEQAPVEFADLAVEYRSVGEAIQGAELVLFAVPHAAVEAIVEEHGSELGGKILIDATNDFSKQEMSNVPVLQTLSPQPKIVRAFNNLGWENFEDPTFDGQQADLFYCCVEQAGVISRIEDLIRQVGLRPVRVGDLDQLPVVNAVTRLWFSLVSARGKGRRLAFKMLA